MSKREHQRESRNFLNLQPAPYLGHHTRWLTLLSRIDGDAPRAQND